MDSTSRLVANLLQGLIFAAMLAWFGRLVANARASKPEVGEDGRPALRYARVLRILMPACGVFMMACAAIIPFLARREEQSTGSVIFLGVMTLAIFATGALGWLVFVFDSITIRADGVVSRAAWRQPRFIAWESLDSVTWKPNAQWYVIKSKDGTVIRAHQWLVGISQLLDELRPRVPKERWHEPSAPHY